METCYTYVMNIKSSVNIRTIVSLFRWESNDNTLSKLIIVLTESLIRKVKLVNTRIDNFRNKSNTTYTRPLLHVQNLHTRSVGHVCNTV